MNELRLTIQDIKITYGTNAHRNMATVVINKNYKANFERLSSLLKGTKGTTIGISIDTTSNFIQPTIVTNLSRNDILFESEIFGPILPILTYKTLVEARETIESIDGTPLALYLMTEDPEEMSWIRDNTLSGGMAFNDIMAQAAVTGMPFGGVGQSGFGSFHGRASIDAFSHRKSVVTVPTAEGFEAMMEMRYADGDLEAKYQIMKQIEQPLE
jgi:acyl-CoA reductase-like NAD-dependent aldehyde dehydrogenase